MLELARLIDLIVGFASPVVQNKLQRSELVIKLLKQLNLDPDHPPADFTAVYQYTLVEYGIGKPKPVLELFRQAEIQAIFRKALDQNNPSLLLKEGETFLAGHTLGDQIQALGIDARQEFYQFAAVFIEVAKRTRTPAEVLANQRLESLHRQIGSIQERLHRLPTLEAMRTEMARLAAQEDRLLLTDSHPTTPPPHHPTPPSATFALAQQMKGWFETLGYRFESYEIWQDDYFEWIIDIPVRRGRYDRILVRGIDGEAGLSDIKALRQSVETQRADEGWLVTARRISRAAREAVEQEENHDLGCYTFDELLDQDADFGGYLDWLDSEIERRGIDQKYVPLACTKEEIDPDTKQRMGVSRYDDRDGWIDGYIDLWLDDPAKEHISVLGEFGTGKTWFAFHYASQSLKRYREAQQRGVERPRLPLVIPLRDYAKAVSVESLFSEFFFRKHEVRSLTYSAFEQLNRMGKLLLIFDGFDEMAARVDRQEMINNFWELAKVVVPGAKVILTCRTEHFPEAREGRALLNAQLQASIANLTGEMPQFEVLELEKFNDEQIRQVMALQAESGTVEQVMSNPQLLDLARRPVMTELILEALPDIEAGKPVDMSRVYLYAVRRKMERDIKEERTFTSLADKLYFLCELSWEMLSSDRMSLNYREFPDRIRRLFGSVVQEEKDLDHWHYDMMGQTMLIRNADGDYMPAHRSLLEFFVAYKFAAELGALAPDFLELAQARANISTYAESQNYRWSSYFRRNNNEEPISPLKGFVSESLEVLRLGFGKAVLTKAVVDLLVRILEPVSLLTTHPLIRVIEITRDKTEDEVSYVGGNSATLLVNLDKISLEGKDLSSTIIRSADFTDASLHGTDFTGANLSNSTFIKTIGSVYSVALSPSGEILATGDNHGEIRFWQALDSQLFLVCRGHSSALRFVIFSPDGQTLASASEDQTVRLWDVQTGQCVKILQGHAEWVFSVTFSPDGSLLASGSGDRTIKIWSVQTGQCIKTLQEHSNFVEPVTFSPDGSLLASGSADRTIKIWNAQTGQCIKTLQAHSSRVRSIAFSLDGQILASGSEDKAVKLWNVQTEQCLKELQDHDAPVRSVAFSPCGLFFASAGEDNTVRIWDACTWQCLKVLQGHSNWVRSISFSSDGKILASGGGERVVKVWKIQTGQCLNTLHGRIDEIRSIAFSPNNLTVACGSHSGAIRMWDVHTGQRPTTLRGHTDRVYSVAFSPDGQSLASGSRDQTIKIWDVHTGQCLATLRGHTDRVYSVVFSPDGQSLISSSRDQTIKIWNTESWKCVQSSQGAARASFITFSQFSNVAASIGENGAIRLWDISSGKSLKNILQSHAEATGFVTFNSIRSIAFSPDGQSLASGGSDWAVKIWSIQTGECLNTLPGHTSWVQSVAFSPDGQILASSSGDWTVRIWSIQTKECLSILQGHTSWVDFIVFSSDGQYLVSASHDQTIKLWSISTGECLNTLECNRPYEGMNVTGVKGLTTAEIATLKALGAVEDEYGETT